MRSIYRLRQATLLLALIICVGISISVISWAKEPMYRPLKADITLSDAIKAAQVLDVYEIDYKLTLPHHLLSVDEEEFIQATVAVRSVGIDIPPPPKYSEALVKAMESAKLEEDYLPIYQQPWFMKMFRLALAACVIIALTLVVMRPMVVGLVYPDRAEKDEFDEEAFADTDERPEMESMQAEASAETINGPKVNPKQDTSPEILITKIDVIGQAKLILALTICVVLAISIIVWSKTPDMRPLINDLREVDAVKVYDTLVQHNIIFRTDQDSHMLYVTYEDDESARLVLSTVGVDIPYPAYTPVSAIPNLQPDNTNSNQLPVYQQPWFMKMFRLALAALMIIVLIVVVMRPMLRRLIYPEDVNLTHEELMMKYGITDSWLLTRLDDNNNEVEIKRFYDKDEAMSMRNEFERRGHKQDYYVYHQTPDGSRTIVS